MGSEDCYCISIIDGKMRPIVDFWSALSELSARTIGTMVEDQNCNYINPHTFHNSSYIRQWNSLLPTTWTSPGQNVETCLSLSLGWVRTTFRLKVSKWLLTWIENSTQSFISNEICATIWPLVRHILYTSTRSLTEIIKAATVRA